jgi:hypothetical protein
MVENIHVKLTKKIDINIDIITATFFVLKNKDFFDILHEYLAELQDIRGEYINILLPVYINYYSDGGKQSVYLELVRSLNLCNKIEAIFQKIQLYLIDILESKLYNDLRINCSSLPDYPNIQYVDAIRKLIQLYNQDKIHISSTTINHSICEFCNELMNLCALDSAMKCRCGNIVKLNGVIFESPNMSQNKNQQDTSKKHAIRWINYTQAIDDVPEMVINKIDKKAIEFYTSNYELRDMSSLSCTKIREWLKTFKLTKYNNLAPSIRKIVTGKHGESQIPPQLSTEEREIILNDIMKVLVAFKDIANDVELLQKLERKKIKKKTYYPFILTKIFCHRLRNTNKLPGLIQCIHFQSSTTLTQDDIIWKKICEIIKFPYEATDLASLKNMKR